MKHLLIAAAIAFASNAASAQEMPLGTLAVRIPQAAVAAVKFRDEGKPKSFLTASLPPQGSDMSRVGREMHQIADDIYDFPSVINPTYFAYTSERFMRELRGEPAPSRFSEVAADVLGCQEKNPGDNTEPLMACVTSVLRNYKPVGRPDGS